MRRLTKPFCAMVVLALCACFEDTYTTHGYVEGDFLYVSPTTSGLLKTLSVSKGQQIKAQHPLFELDQTDVLADHLMALASLKVAESTYEDLTKGQRPEELEIIIKQKEQARATLVNAEREYQRTQKLTQTKSASQAALDNAASLYKAAKGKLEELEAQLKSASLGARSDKINAAKAAVESARQSLTKAEKRLKDSAPLSPQTAFVQDTYFRPGEYVTAGQPVLSLLLPDRVRVRFFMTQADVARLKLGQSIHVSCDGIKDKIPAKITYISSNAEYTPPVIYSIGSRDKLVFLVEAQPDTYSPNLRPGLPVDISLTFSKP